MDIDKLVEFCAFVKGVVKKISIEASDRTKIIAFKDILYCCLYMNGNSCSYSTASLNMYVDNIIDVSDPALITKRDTVSFGYFKKISNEIRNFIYKNNDTPRILAVDGTSIPLSIELEKYEFHTSPKKTYCIGLISSLYDLNEKILINYRLCKEFDEREGLMGQLKYLKSGDTLIMDRGYYSGDLLWSLNKMGVHVIFRMKKNMLMVKQIIEKGQMSMNTTVSINGVSIPFRIIAYQVNDNDYFLGTTIMNHKVNYFVNLYWERWGIETHFRDSKYLLSLSNILSRDPNKVQQDIYSHHILFLFNSFFKNHIQKLLPAGKYVNSKNMLCMITQRIIQLILYDKMTTATKEVIEKICTGLLKSPVIKTPDRHYERIRKNPIGQWYYITQREQRVNQ